jgi:TRAP-type mannitol/chloroaromatic compound transport system permease large subunit
MDAVLLVAAFVGVRSAALLLSHLLPLDPLGAVLVQLLVLVLDLLLTLLGLATSTGTALMSAVCPIITCSGSNRLDWKETMQRGGVVQGNRTVLSLTLTQH